VSKKHVLKVELGERSYDIIVQPSISRDAEFYLKPFISGRKCLIVTDHTVNDIYGHKTAKTLSGSGAKVSSVVFKAGETSKNLDTIREFYQKAVNEELDRSSLVVALGGGVCGDMAGFMAATYMRGIDFIQIPTSLLAMVDSSVGGKTGVDLPEGKNLVGAFWQPVLVLIDPELLETLPANELRCGLAEIIKYAVILDAELFELLENNIEKLKKLDLDFYSGIISRCCRLKAEVVSKDEREGGLRAILNYGHTFGHAIEAVSGYNSILHGEAIAVGMAIAADLAVKLGTFDKTSADRQEKLMKALELPVTLKNYDAEKILEAMGNDKKKQDGKIKLILPEKIGSVSISPCADRKLMLEVIRNRCS